MYMIETAPILENNAMTDKKCKHNLSIFLRIPFYQKYEVYSFNQI